MNAKVNFTNALEVSVVKPVLIAKESLTLEDKIQDSISRIKSIFSENKVCLVASSHGKDSAVMSNIVFQAAIEFKNENGHCPHIRFVTSNTRIENPVMDNYVKKESKKLIEYADKHGLDVNVDLVTPGTSNNYLVNMIGGRIIASMSDNDAKCSSMMKVDPINRHKKRVLKKFGKDNIVTLVGKRSDESVEREKNMSASGEADGVVVEDKKGELLLCPIADFTLDDIFFYIGNVRSGKIDCYSDFDDLVEIYRDANGGDCMVTTYYTGQASKSACGARTGCFLCTRISSDKSLENMLTEDKFKFMQPLNDLRQFIIDTHYNPNRRNWLARSIKPDGSVRISPNAYSPQHCEELLRIILTIDAKEREAAYGLGIKPRFQMLSLADVLSIELLWARYGYQTTAKALHIWNDIVNNYEYYDIPSTIIPSTKQDLKLKLSSKRIQFLDHEYGGTFSGFRNIEAAIADCEDITLKSDGKHYSNAQTDVEFRIDEEGLELFEYFEFENFLNKYKTESYNPTAVLHYFIGLGTVVLSKGNHSEMDRMLQMANLIQRHGIRGLLNDPDKLIKKIHSNLAKKALSLFSSADVKDQLSFSL